MVNLDAIAAGAFPDPAGVDEVPWMVRDRLFMIRDADAGPQSVMASYDLRSMRKYNGAENLRIIADADSASAWTIRSQSRVLVKLP